VPSVSLLAEFPVAIVDTVVDKRGSRELAKSYLDFLYTREGQTIAAENGNRVHDAAVTAQFKDKFPEVRLVTVEDVFGGWANASRRSISRPMVCSTRFTATVDLNPHFASDGRRPSGNSPAICLFPSKDASLEASRICPGCRFRSGSPCFTWPDRRAAARRAASSRPRASVPRITGAS
jgi:hypothetical protein